MDSQVFLDHDELMDTQMFRNPDVLLNSQVFRIMIYSWRVGCLEILMY